jgi:hypothetical protein
LSGGLVRSLILIGGFFFVGLYNLVASVILKRQPEFFLLGIAALAMAVRTLELDDYLFFQYV